LFDLISSILGPGSGRTSSTATEATRLAIAGTGPAMTDVTAVVTPVLIMFLVSREEERLK